MLNKIEKEYFFLNSISHIYEIIALDQVCFSNSYWLKNTWLQKLEDVQQNILCFSIKSKIIGFLCFSMIEEEVQILKIGIHPTYQHQGFGYKLLQYFIEYLYQQQKAVTIFLEVRAKNTNAIQLYNKFQFDQIAIRKNYYKSPLDDALCICIKN